MFIIYGWKEWMKFEGLVAALWKLSAFRWIALRNIILTIRKQDNLRLSSKCFLQPNLELDNWIGLKALGAGVTRVFDGKNTAVSIFHSSKIVQMIQGNQAREESDEILWTSLGTTHVWRYSKIFSSKVGRTCFGRWWKTPPDPTMIKHDKTMFSLDHVGITSERHNGDMPWGPAHTFSAFRSHPLGPCSTQGPQRLRLRVASNGAGAKAQRTALGP